MTSTILLTTMSYTCKNLIKKRMKTKFSAKKSKLLLCCEKSVIKLYLHFLINKEHNKC